jgi:benzoyl-CoA reductase/2-hydroxyglutaryl-CoA dehydratase subunit BcrC/BadD/HgdB
MTDVSDAEWKKVESALKMSNTGVGAYLRIFEQANKKLTALAGKDVSKMIASCSADQAAKASKYAREAYQALNKATSAAAKASKKVAGIAPGGTPPQKAYWTFVNAAGGLASDLVNVSTSLGSKAASAAGRKTITTDDFKN